jgi:starch-binding outer membrane protein, SusD/RagB family
MKNNFIKQTAIYTAAIAVSLGAASCSKLDEKVFGSKSVVTASAGGAATADLKSVYEATNALVTQGNWYALQEHSTDELLGPTRGTDWDDFGTWRKIHLHAVDGAHNQLYDTWNGLNSGLFKATLVAEKGSAADQPAAKFLRAFMATQVMDVFGQVPYRAATDGPDVIPAVKTRSEAFDWIMTDLDAAIAALPSNVAKTDSRKATKQAAQFLKARLMLNKAVYKADPKTPTTFTHAAGDMNTVIAMVDAITASTKFSLSANYWDNFVWDNNAKSTELIYSRGGADADKEGQLGGTINVNFATGMGTHYNQTFSGWNGFTTTADFYNSFPEVDKRRQADIAGYTELTGFNAGFLAGQQYKYDKGVKVKVKDRAQADLVFTPDVSLFFSTESKGIRTMKYPMEYKASDNSFTGKNDFVFFRYADALLMKAEAILRGGTATGGETALSIVNSLRARSGVPALTAVTLNDILAERGRELYLEAVRRPDLIRFGKYNDPVNERSAKSDAYKVVYPIPNQAVSSNPNLKQNFGY